MFNRIRENILMILNKLNHNCEKLTASNILIDEPREKSYGDLYTNVAMMFGKKFGMSPKALAEIICEGLRTNVLISDISIAGAGFINMKLKNHAWHEMINKIIMYEKKYSYSDEFHGTKINLEFVSANPTGPLHTGHARNAVFGSVVANLLERIGYNVTREFYINDQGNQIKYLARSVYLRYQEILGKNISMDDFSSDMYCGNYVKELAQEIVDKYQDKFLEKEESEWIDFFCKYSIDRMLENIKTDLRMIGVVMDKYTSEASLCKRNMVDESLKILEQRGDIYEGVLPKPKGISDVDDWEARPQTLFKSTKYGDDIDRAIKKSDGTWTYFAGDLAYHLDKIRRGYTKMIAILGADHNGYVKRLKAAVGALSNNKSEIEIRLYQLVNFLENGKPVKMSKRAGTFITLKEVVERVGKDVTRYMMISRHHDVMIDFDFVKAVEQSMDNPLFYIQYAYARISSVFRCFETSNGKIEDQELIDCDKSILTDDAEISLIKSLTLWKEQIASAARAIEPHRIPVYMQNIASLFHSLWNKGKSNSKLRFINPDNKEETIARLSLLKATKNVLDDGFAIMGIKPMSEMI